MDSKIILVRTSKGNDETNNKTSLLSGDIKRALLMVDGVANFGEISKRAAPSLRSTLDEMFNELEKKGFIQDKAKAGNILKMAVPQKMSTPLKKPVDDGPSELDFTSVFRAPTPEAMAAEGAKVQAEKLKVEAEAKARAEADAEAKARQEIEAAKLKAQQEAEMARRKAEQEVAQARAELEAAKVKAAAEAKARALADAKAEQEVEAAKLRAQQEAETARRKAEQEAAQARAEMEAAKAKADAEAKARALAEAKAKQEIEAAKLRANQEAEAARYKAEQEVIRVRAELEATKAKAEAEAKARALAEAKAKQEAEAARIEAEAKTRAEAIARQEVEAAKLKAQQEAEEARLKTEREAARAREEAERHAREEAEAARVKAEQEAARVRAELEAAKAKAEAEAKARAEVEAKARQEIEVAKLKTQQEAKEARLKAEQEAAKARKEAELAKQKAVAEARAREEAEAVRVKAEQDAARVRTELEAAKAKADAEAKAREEAERAKQQVAAEAREREEAEQRATQEAEAWANLKEQQESEAALLQNARDAAQASATTKAKSEAGTTARTTSATVLFFDVVGYTKQSVNKQIELKKQFNQLVSDCLKLQGDGERIILDTGDGAAIGFMQHPDDALEVAIQFRKTVMANQHKDYPDLKVRIGIHLGPVNIIQDMNGRSNMVGDGINDAQRVMSFAGTDQIYISRSYYDFVSRLSDEYADLFQYRGAQKDKHGREHPVYELVDAVPPAAEVALPQIGEPTSEIKLEPFSFKMPDGLILPKAADSLAPAVPHEEPKPQQGEAALISDVGKFLQPEEAKKSSAAEQAGQEKLPPSGSTFSPGTPETPLPKEADKPVAKSHMPSDAEVAKLAEAQAKSWAEAEQRAIETAKENTERAVQPQRHPSHITTKDTAAARAGRKPIPWGMLGAGLFALLLLALFAAPYVLPMRDYVPKIEQMLADRLKQPVHIGHLSGRLLPAPRLELSEVSIGDAKQIQARQARVDFALSALFSAAKPITGVNLEGVQINGAALQQIATWLQQIAADTRYPIARIGLSQGKLEADGIQLSGVGGELSFDPAGKFIKAKLNAEESKFALDINASPDSKLQMTITVRASALPLLPNWVFDELTAKGELADNELVITDLDGRFLGGMLLGDARINWGSGWKAQGALVAKTITTQNINKLLGGDVDGTARFQMQSTSLSKLTDAATLDGTFAIKKGVINGFDIVETARQHSRESLPGGRTHFDELSGDLSYANGEYHFKQLKMSAGVLNATGTLDISKQQLSGRISADLAMRAAMGTVALQVDGTTSSPSLRAVR